MAPDLLGAHLGSFEAYLGGLLAHLGGLGANLEGLGAHLEGLVTHLGSLGIAMELRSDPPTLGLSFLKTFS